MQKLIERFGLKPHTEGGHYRQTYESPLTLPHDALPDGFSGDRPTSTAIVFLLRRGERSRLHRLCSDEIWHAYLGGPLTLVSLFDDGRVEQICLGHDIDAGCVPQHVIPAGCWFGAYLHEDVEYAFVGCTVSPGFDFAEFELADRATLVAQYPSASPLIVQLT